MAEVCDLLNFGSDPTVYDNVAHMASELLWAASGRQFSGSCSRTVRPCVRSCQCWPVGLGANGWAWGWDSVGWSWGAYWLGGGGNGVSAVQDCGGGGGCCGSLSRVKLPGYPVTNILEVKIDGVVIDPVNYRLDAWKYLTYLNTPTIASVCFPIFSINAAAGQISIEGDHTSDFTAGDTVVIEGSSGNDGTYEIESIGFGVYTDIQLTTSLNVDVADGNLCSVDRGCGEPQRWPSCQNLACDDTEPGTFSVAYEFGVDPPEIGLEAAAELACALVRAGGGDCEIPAGATRIDRQGITIDLLLFPGMLPPGLGALPLTQAFLRACNPAGLTRRSSLYTPDLAPFAQKMG